MVVDIIKTSENEKVFQTNGNQQGQPLLTSNSVPAIRRKRSHRVLIINESIEIDLSTDSESDPEDYGQVVEPVDHHEEDNMQICEPPASHSDDSNDNGVLIIDLSDDTVAVEEKVHSRITDNAIEKCKTPVSREYLQYDSSYRKIAPKESLDSIVQCRDEVWRMKPPKKFKKLNKERSIELIRYKPKKSESLVNLKSNDLKIDGKSFDLLVSQLRPALPKPPQVKKNTNRVEIPMEIVKNIKLGKNLQETNYSETDLKLMQCPYCNYKSPREAIIKKHIVNFHTDFIRCSDCEYKVISEKNLESHVSSHGQTCVPKCSLCKKTRKSVFYLRLHITSMHKKEVFQQCTLCGFEVNTHKSFKIQIDCLRRHVHEKHSSESETIYSCPICKFSTTLDLEMKSHIYLIHSELKGSFFQCIKCPIITSTLTELIEHADEHQKEKIFCKKCKFSSSNELRINLHARTHSKNLFKCPHCHFKNKHHFLLKYHIQGRHKNSRDICRKKR